LGSKKKNGGNFNPKVPFFGELPLENFFSNFSQGKGAKFPFKISFSFQYPFPLNLNGFPGFLGLLEGIGYSLETQKGGERLFIGPTKTQGFNFNFGFTQGAPIFGRKLGVSY